MLFMVIERFRSPESVTVVYERLREGGRQVPDGLRYVDSWVELGFGRCFQVMECDDARLLQDWMLHWQDLVDFEVVPVVTSADAAEGVARAQPSGSASKD